MGASKSVPVPVAQIAEIVETTPPRASIHPILPKDTHIIEGEDGRVLFLFMSVTPEQARSLLTKGDFPRNSSGKFGKSGIYFTETPTGGQGEEVEARVMVGKSLVRSKPLTAATYEIIKENYHCDSVKGNIDSEWTGYVVYRKSQVLIKKIRIHGKVEFQSNAELNDWKIVKELILKQIKDAGAR